MVAWGRNDEIKVVGSIERSSENSLGDVVRVAFVRFYTIEDNPALCSIVDVCGELGHEGNRWSFRTSQG